MKVVKKVAGLVLALGIFLGGASSALADTLPVDSSLQEVVEKHLSADVTGDGQQEDIALVTTKYNPGDIYAHKICVIVTGEEYLLIPEEYVGYMPDIQLIDLNGDRVDDFLISMGTGGSSGANLYYSFTLKDKQFKELISIQDNTGMVPLDMKFLDNYMVEIKNSRWEINEVLSLQANKETYENEEFQAYVNGVLKQKQVTPYIDPYVSLVPVDDDGDGQYELLGTQYIWGFYHADTLAEFKTLLKYQENEWQLVSYQLRNLVNPSKERFSDVPASHWAKPAIEWAVEQGIIQGYPEGTFKPDKAVNDVEFITMLINSFKNSNNVDLKKTQSKEWPFGYLDFAVRMNYPTNLTAGDGKFTRKDAAELLASTQGVNYLGVNAIHYVLGKELAKGRLPGELSIKAYQGEDLLTRAEAIELIKNAGEKGLGELKARPEKASPVSELPKLPG